MPDKIVDFAAVGRVSHRVELRSIRLLEIKATCGARGAGRLEARLESDCSVLSWAENALEILCDYKFSALSAEEEIASALIKYVVSYETHGEEPISDEDLAHFALANGTAHTWPFLRECVYGLTAKMGYPPYTLPVVHFRPKPAESSPGPPTS